MEWHLSDGTAGERTVARIYLFALIRQRVFRAVNFKVKVAAGRAVRVAGATHIANKFFFFYVLPDLRFNFFKVGVKCFNFI